jgi:hypothetical protein
VKIGHGSEIIFRLDKDKVIIETHKIEDPIRTLQSIALKGKCASKVDLHFNEEELHARNPRCSTWMREYSFTQLSTVKR